MEHAYRLAPNNHWTFTLKAFQLIEQGDFDALESFLQKELELNPAHGVAPLPQIARVRLALAARSKVYRGDHAAAVDLYERALGEPFTSILEIGFDADALAFLAYSYRQLGERQRSDEAIARCRELIASRQDWVMTRLILSDTLAATYAIEGRDDEAVATLDRALDDGWALYSVLRFNPFFERLRERSDFQDLVQRLEDRLAAMRDRVRDDELAR